MAKNPKICLHHYKIAQTIIDEIWVGNSLKAYLQNIFNHTSLAFNYQSVSKASGLSYGQEESEP